MKLYIKEFYKEENHFLLLKIKSYTYILNKGFYLYGIKDGNILWIKSRKHAWNFKLQEIAQEIKEAIKRHINFGYKHVFLD